MTETRIVTNILKYSKCLLFFALIFTAFSASSFSLDKATVTDVSIDSAKNEDVINIGLSSAIEPKVFYLKEPLRMVVDFSGAVWEGGKQEKNNISGNVSFIRWAQNNYSPDNFRVVIGLTEGSAGSIIKEADGKKVAVKISGQTKTEDAVSPSRAASKETVEITTRQGSQEAVIKLPEFVESKNKSDDNVVKEKFKRPIEASARIKFPKLQKIKGFSVILNGKKLALGRKPLFVNNILMANAKDVFELCGYDLSYNKKTGTATAVLSDEAEVKIKADSKYIFVNGVKRPLNATTKSVSGKLFVPVYPVVKWLGLSAFWDKKTKRLYISNRITDISWDEIKKHIVIRSNVAVPTYEIETREDPIMLVVKIPDFILDTEKTKIPIKEEEVRGIKAFQAKGETKIGIYLESEQISKIYQSEKEINILFPPAIQTIEITEEAKFTRVNIYSSKAVAFEAKYLSEPDRIIIDVPNSLFRAQTKRENGKTGVLRVRASQFSFEPLVSRMVIDLSGPLKYETAVTDDNKIFSVFVEKPRQAVPQKAIKTKKIEILKDKVIVIDPGHGGNDPGAFGISGSGIKEKNLNLAVSNKLASLLSEAGAIPLMTRDDDSEISLQKRVDFAKNNNADIYVSMHFNASEDKPGTSGTEVYYFNPNSKLLAQIIDNNLTVHISRPNRGVSKIKFYVIYNSPMPSVLVEPVYLTNREEESLAADPVFQDRVARGVFEGIKQYFDVLSNI